MGAIRTFANTGNGKGGNKKSAAQADTRTNADVTEAADHNCLVPRGLEPQTPRKGGDQKKLCAGRCTDQGRGYTGSMPQLSGPTRA